MNIYIPKNLTAFLIDSVKPYVFSFFILLLFRTYISLHPSLESYIIKNIIDFMGCGVVEINLQSTLFYFLYLFISVRLLYMISAFFADYIQGIILPSIKMDIAKKLLNNVWYHKQSFYGAEGNASLSNHVVLMQNSAENLIYNSTRIYSFIFEVIFSSACALTVNYWYAISIFVWALLFLVFAKWLSTYLHYLSYKLASVNHELVKKMGDSIANILSVKLFSRYDFENSRLEESLQKSLRKDQAFGRAQAFSWLILQGMCFVVFAIIFSIGLFSSQSNMMSAGEFAFLIGIINYMNYSMFSILWNFQDMLYFMGRGTRSLELFKKDIDTFMISRTVPSSEKILNPNIDFYNVSFGYHPAQSLFSSLNVHIPFKQLVGLVGLSGSGKTTFVKLIMRLEQTSQGVITIGDKDVSLLPEEVLRSCITFVPQDPLLFSRSIKDNILYGNPSATDEQVALAAVQAEIHEFIVNLPSGYQTIIGENGIALSGGQRQRVIIARALLKNAPIIILDEPTAALDPISESAIKKVIYNLAHIKTVLIITHRLSTAEHLDRILVFDKGSIVEDGTHQELLHQKGLYKNLWRSSYSEFLDDENEEII